jgi:plastocyanin
MSTRRSFLTAGGLALASLAVPGVVRATARRAEIQMRSIPRGARRWGSIRSGYGSSPARPSVGTMASLGNLHATTAYHPRNANHSLRIPEAAAPWDSGLLVKSGDTFEVTLTDVYDYFCLPHEAAGMVGRIVVGRPGGRPRCRSTTSQAAQSPRHGYQYWTRPAPPSRASQRS